ncbi:hypothetical protein A2U01_0101512, partial [Trifolium medium]|nr:hypothetical protein [Trifolium medium]
MKLSGEVKYPAKPCKFKASVNEIIWRSQVPSKTV